MSKKHNQIISTKDISPESLVTKTHPLNANAQRNSFDLGSPTGMKNIGIHYVILKPRMTSTEPHFHHTEEEAIFIIEGSGVASIGDQEIGIKEGDFISYPCNGLCHSIRNDSDSDLMYLILGEKSKLDVCVYPIINKALIRTKDTATLVDNYSQYPNIREQRT